MIRAALNIEKGKGRGDRIGSEEEEGVEVDMLGMGWDGMAWVGWMDGCMYLAALLPQWILSCAPGETLVDCWH